ncbi:MAG TPA: carboxyl transferase domain-containing protein, partial [Acidimicrobiia bacterium]|nr:carboxyl transferase domain-containing protein [Acidimicrobiia bacterium]
KGWLPGATPSPFPRTIAAMDIQAPVAARIAQIAVEAGAVVSAGATLVILEVMKMERPITAPEGGVVETVKVALGDTVDTGDSLMTLQPTDAEPASGSVDESPELASFDLVEDRHRLVLDEARPDAVEARHERGRRTVRENLDDLCEDYVEYGPLAVAAQQSRRDLDDLIAKTPADGMVGGGGRIATGPGGDDRAIVISYDYTVLAGTQGARNHHKKDRLFALAAETGLPVVLFAEGGGGRPGDVDWNGVSLLDVRAFRLFSEIPGPTIGVNTGYCFAGNAALLGQCDVIVATPDSNLGMGGPAMIEGGGLGRFSPNDVGPADVQTSNGVVDVVVEDDREAVSVVRQLVGMVRGRTEGGESADQSRLRSIVPSDRRRLYEVRQIVDCLFDVGSFVELRREYAPAAVTGIGRIDGHPIGLIANDPAHLAGAIDNDAARSFTRHLELCDRWGIPVISLCDTPGFMVGPDAEAEGLVRSAGELFRAAGRIGVPIGTIVTRRGFGLGAQAMAAGGFHEPRFTIAWPNSEFGPMGLEGAVKLGFRKELEAIEDPEQRQSELERRVEEMARAGRGINVAMAFEIDDVIDPADSRHWITTLLVDDKPFCEDFRPVSGEFHSQNGFGAAFSRRRRGMGGDPSAG